MPRMIRPRLALAACSVAAAALTTIACKTPEQPASEAKIFGFGEPAPTGDITFDPGIGESAWPGEEAATKGVVEGIQKTIKARYTNNPPARRDAHPKAHGCVLADFEVNDTVSAPLEHGVFQSGAKYKAWIRFSNGDGDPTRADGKGDARGMAIKLMGVPGDKLLPDEKNTQDFIMINHPVFFINDPQKYQSLIETLGSTNPIVQLSAPIHLGIEGALIARKITAKKIASPLSTRFFSMVPYQLGTGPERRAMKFSAKPCAASDNVPTSVQLQDPDYLRKAMKKQLATKAACFEFLVQARAPDPSNSAALNIERPTEEWTEAEAPFVKVATITIPKQNFDKPAQHTFCENLSFNPWHAVAAHRPLGSVNRVRKAVYTAISSLRHDMNHAAQTEPNGTETF